MAKVLVSQKEFIVITNDKLFELNIISGKYTKFNEKLFSYNF